MNNSHIDIIKAYIEKIYPEVTIHMHFYHGNLRFDTIWLPKTIQRKGIGTSIMNFIVSYADKNGLTLTLTPAKKELYDFYYKFGFVKTRVFSDSMMRIPMK